MPEMMLNPFDVDAFGAVELTKAINILPNNYGLLEKRNVFPERGVMSRTVLIEEQNGVLSLLPTMPVGSKGTQNKQGKRKMRSLVIPHIPMDDSIMPEEYAGVREFGSAAGLKTLASIMNQHLQTGRNKFGITLEYLRIGALKGLILDADASELYNLYTEFGITAKTINFALTTPGTNVMDKCRELIRHVEDNALGEVFAGVRVLVSEEFFDAFIAHANVEKFWVNHLKAVEFAEGNSDPRKGFRFGGLIFEEYRGKATDGNGTTRRFIAEAEGHAYPTGTMNAFETVLAPGDFLETTNQLGQLLYAKQEARKFNRGIDIHMQSNPLPICYRPGMLVKVTKS